MRSRIPAVVDTNIFIYAHDPTDPAKQIQAQEVIEDLTVAGHLVTTAQVLSESRRAQSYGATAARLWT